MNKIITSTYRSTPDENERFKELANNLGVSQNTLISMALNLFEHSYKSIIEQNQTEFLRFLSQKN